MLHEAVRDELAQPILAARAAPHRLCGLRMRSKPFDRIEQLPYACAGRRHRLEDGRPPLGRCDGLQREIGFHRGDEPIGALAIRLVHHENVGNFHDAGLERLHFVAGPGDERHDRNIRCPNDVHLVLAHADRFDDDDVLAGRVEDQRRVACRARQPSQLSTRRHAPDEDSIVARVRLHPQPVAKNRATRERARRIDGDDADSRRAIANVRHEPIDQRTFSGPGIPGDTDDLAASAGSQQLQGRAAGRSPILDQGDEPRRLRASLSEAAFESPEALTEAWPSLTPEERVDAFKRLPRATAGNFFLSRTARGQALLVHAAPEHEHTGAEMVPLEFQHQRG